MIKNAFQVVFAKIAKNSPCFLGLNSVFYKPKNLIVAIILNAFNIRVIETKIWENAWQQLRKISFCETANLAHHISLKKNSKQKNKAL